MVEGATAQFTATVACDIADGCPQEVTWSADTGAITREGRYTAPVDFTTRTVVTVTAASASAPSVLGTAQATVVLVARTDSVVVTPPAAEVSVSSEDTQRSVQFAAAVYGRGEFSREVRWYVNGVEGGNADVGTISRQGLYVAPARSCLDVPLMLFVSAVAVADPSTKDSASVEVSEPPMDSEPRLCWTSYFSSVNGTFESFTSVGADSSGDILAAGFSLTGGISTFSMLFVSYDKFGALKWSKALSQPRADVSSMTPAPVGGNYPFIGRDMSHIPAYCGRIAGDGELVVDPATHQISGGVDMILRAYGGDLFVSRAHTIARLDADCNFMEETSLSATRLGPAGLAVTAEHYFVTRIDQTEPVGISNTNTYLEKFLRDGSLECEYRFVDTDDVRVALDAEGAVWVSGRRFRSSGGDIWFISRMDQNCNVLGSVEWESGVSPNVGHSMALHPNGGVVLVGTTSDHQGYLDNRWDIGAWAVDASLNTRWAILRDFQSSDDEASGLTFMPNGDLVIAGGQSWAMGHRGLLTKWRVPK
jgi:hypothetical protein